MQLLREIASDAKGANALRFSNSGVCVERQERESPQPRWRRNNSKTQNNLFSVLYYMLLLSCRRVSSLNCSVLFEIWRAFDGESWPVGVSNGESYWSINHFMFPISKITPRPGSACTWQTESHEVIKLADKRCEHPLAFQTYALTALLTWAPPAPCLAL